MVLGFSNNVDQKSRDQQAKLIKENVTKSEVLMTAMLNSIQKTCRKEAAVRDASDALCKSFQNVSNEETPNIRNGMSAMANSISQITDYREAMLNRIDTRVTSKIQNYEAACKQVKQSVTIQQKSKNTQNMAQQNLHSLQGNGQPGQLAHSQADLQRAIINTQQGGFAMEETADIFERQKKTDMKQFMLDYVNSLMQFHANALECLAECKPYIEKIDVDSDMVWFRQGLRIPNVGMYNNMMQPGMQQPGMQQGMYGQPGMMSQVPGMQNPPAQPGMQPGMTGTMGMHQPLAVQGSLQSNGYQNQQMQNQQMGTFGAQQNGFQQTPVSQATHPNYNSAPGFIQHQPQPLTQQQQQIPVPQTSNGVPLDNRFGSSGGVMRQSNLRGSGGSIPRSVSFNMPDDNGDTLVEEYEARVRAQNEQVRTPAWD